MTSAECEIVANAGMQLREIAQRITVPAHVIYADLDVAELLTTMDRAALAISEVYGALASLPLDNDFSAGTVAVHIGNEVYRLCTDEP